MLNTLSNFGGIWPAYPVNQLIAFTETKACVAGEGAVPGPDAPLCDRAADCEGLLGGATDVQCVPVHDYFFTILAGAFCLGLLVYYSLLRARMARLTKFTSADWRSTVAVAKRD